MERPLRILTASCLATLVRTPFYLSRASWSVQTRLPSPSTSMPLRYSLLLVGRGRSTTSFDKYLGDGQSGSCGRVLSWNE